MVTEELKEKIILGGTSLEDEFSNDEQELTESFAPFSEWIARGAMSHTQTFPDMKEVTRPVSKACRAIMKIARHENKIPTECIDFGCEIAEVEVSDLMKELDNLSKHVSMSKARYKGRGGTERPVCPYCREDMKVSLEHVRGKSPKKYGHHCLKCKYQTFD